MEHQEYLALLNMLKPLADENRLRLISLLSQREWTVGDVAQTLDVADSTASYHISKLHSAGLVRLRMAGNHRYYRANEKQVGKLKHYVNQIDTPIQPPRQTESDESWIDALDWDDWEKKVLRTYFVDGRLTKIPSKDKKFMVILRWLVTKFEPDVRYTEKQVNAIIKEIHEDYATIRRYLVGFGFMRRERGGGDYWLTPEDEAAP